MTEIQSNSFVGIYIYIFLFFYLATNLMLRFSARANREIVKCESRFTGKSVFGGCLKWLDFVWKRITELR